ncbi:MAG: GNAT family N-acetyltransferase [Patescibacteria group bacterium]|jgi:L-amino acid N-acyltransferase YncA|nr:GNAT family N-acetyltransferase [Patescibacteria group bacterium]
MAAENPEYIPVEAREQLTNVEYGVLTPDDTASIAEYYQFEINQGFSQVPEQSSLEGMIAWRQKQIQEGKLQVAVARQEGKIVGTAVMALENEIMGKKLQPNEAWAAGTVVDKRLSGQGVGRGLVEQEDEIARQAGKEAILTTITQDNLPSMRLYLKSGYSLEALDEREDEICYRYRKDLKESGRSDQGWVKAVEQGELKPLDAEIDEQTPNQILISPQDSLKVKAALEAGYRGVQLVSPRDFEEQEVLDQAYLVFTK